jgi:dipeptidyl-peptidase-4
LGGNIDIDDNLIFLNDGLSILRTSEKNGYKHIYKLDFSGKETQITKGNWDVIEFCGIDNQNKFIYYTAAKKGAIHKGIYKIDLKGNKDIAISSETGQNETDFTPGMNYFVKNYSNANTPPVYSLCDNNGKEIAVLENNETLKNRIKQYEFSKKEFVTFDLDGRSLNGWIIKPTNFDSSKKYPVYVSIYGGPGSNTVSDGWDFNNSWHQLLAQEGYIVVSVDPRGTMYRGKAFKDLTYLQLGKYETEDFIDVAKLLQTYPYVDKNRIGIQGWSYGGFMTSLAMTKGNGIFKMGIAVAPVTNWKYYDNIYTERFMRTPQENESGYNDNSPIYFANQLQGNYFLIHGSGDDNVHYQNAMEMANALIAANKKFDFFIYPNRNHGIYGGNTRLHLYNMMLEYVKKNL